MSLINDFQSTCMLYEKQRTPDGEGGFKVSWIEGAVFPASITFDTSIQARSAEKQGVSSLYTVTISKSTRLEYHDVFKRLSDGKVFRVTSDSNDKQTPARASFQIAQVTAEEWELTS